MGLGYAASELQKYGIVFTLHVIRQVVDAARTMCMSAQPRVPCSHDAIRGLIRCTKNHLRQQLTSVGAVVHIPSDPGVRQWTLAVVDESLFNSAEAKLCRREVEGQTGKHRKLFSIEYIHSMMDQQREVLEAVDGHMYTTGLTTSKRLVPMPL